MLLLLQAAANAAASTEAREDATEAKACVAALELVLALEVESRDEGCREAECSLMRLCCDLSVREVLGVDGLLTCLSRGATLTSFSSSSVLTRHGIEYSGEEREGETQPAITVEVDVEVDV